MPSPRQPGADWPLEESTALEAGEASVQFEFWGCSEIRESLGIRADTELHLMERIASAPAESIYYHTVRSLLRRRVVPTPFPDDFATWVAVELRDLVLAERLAFPSPFDYTDIEGFRECLLSIFDDHLSRLPSIPRSLFGNPFYFLRGHLVAVPLDVRAWDLRSFRDALSEVDESSLYFHAVECAGPWGRPESTFTAWVQVALGEKELAAALRLDPFITSLKQLRGNLLRILDRALVEQNS
jgi:hypothetical protein